MTVNAITDTKKGRTGIAPTYLHTTPDIVTRTHQESQNCLTAVGLQVESCSPVSVPRS